MPRYHFHVFNRVRVTDPYGTLLPNDKSALIHALQVARELMFKRTGMLGQPWTAWTMRVNDQDGKTIHSIPFGELPEGNNKH
jgi:hypothetical protein